MGGTDRSNATALRQRSSRWDDRAHRIHLPATPDRRSRACTRSGRSDRSGWLGSRRSSPATRTLAAAGSGRGRVPSSNPSGESWLMPAVAAVEATTRVRQGAAPNRGLGDRLRGRRSRGLRPRARGSGDPAPRLGQDHHRGAPGAPPPRHRARRQRLARRRLQGAGGHRLSGHAPGRRAPRPRRSGHRAPPRGTSRARRPPARRLRPRGTRPRPDRLPDARRRGLVMGRRQAAGGVPDRARQAPRRSARAHLHGRRLARLAPGAPAHPRPGG